MMAYAKFFAKQMNYREENIIEMIDDMKSRDYDHLIEIFEDHFGGFVTLWK